MAKVQTAERLAILETEMAAVQDAMKEQRALLGELQTSVDKINTQLTKYTARWGGMMMVLAALGALLSAAKDWIIAHFSR